MKTLARFCRVSSSDVKSSGTELLPYFDRKHRESNLFCRQYYMYVFSLVTRYNLELNDKNTFVKA